MKHLFLLLLLSSSVGVFGQYYAHGRNRVSTRPKPPTTYTVPDTNMISIAKEVFRVVNEYRIKKGLDALKLQKELNQIAFEHSYRMASGQISFSHTDFHERVKMIDKYANIKYRTAENLYAHKISPTKFPYEALNGWINSPGHKKNMDGQFIHTGLGVCRSKTGELFVTQVFVGKASFLLAGTKGVEDLEAVDESTGTIPPAPTQSEEEYSE